MIKSISKSKLHSIVYVVHNNEITCVLSNLDQVLKSFKDVILRKLIAHLFLFELSQYYVHLEMHLSTYIFIYGIQNKIAIALLNKNECIWHSCIMQSLSDQH